MSYEQTILERLDNIVKEISAIKEEQRDQATKLDKAILAIVTQQTREETKHLRCRGEFDERYVLIKDVSSHLAQRDRETARSTRQAVATARDILNIVNMVIVIGGALIGSYLFLF
jgi:hypothetical protein